MRPSSPTPNSRLVSGSPGALPCLKACQLVQLGKARVVKVLAARGEGCRQPVEGHQKPVEELGQGRR